MKDNFDMHCIGQVFTTYTLTHGRTSESGHAVASMFLQAVCIFSRLLSDAQHATLVYSYMNPLDCACDGAGRRQRTDFSIYNHKTR